MTSWWDDESEETPAGGLPEVIQLPDLRQLTKKVTSGSENRQRRHLEQFRTDDDEHAALHAQARAAGLSFGAYMRALKLGDAGPRAQRRAPVDAQALTQGLVAFSRGNNNLNQLARTGNSLAIFAEERGMDRLAEQVRDLKQEIERLRQEFVVPVAAILAALNHDREG